MTTAAPALPESVARLPMIHVSEVREGDIVFCSRPGFLQSLCSSAGELWRHVGIALYVDSADGRTMGIVEVDGDRFVTRTMAQVQGGYTYLAVARLSDEVDRAGAIEWARYFIGSRNAYAWDDAVLAGFVALTRWHAGDGNPELAARVVRRASLAATERWTNRRVSHTCSSFVYFAFNSGADHDRLVVDLEISQRVAAEVMSIGPVPVLRGGRGSRIDRQQLIEAARVVVGALGGFDPGPAAPDAIGRWVMPGDLWRSPSIRFRALLPCQESSS